MLVLGHEALKIHLGANYDSSDKDDSKDKIDDKSYCIGYNDGLKAGLRHGFQKAQEENAKAIQDLIKKVEEELGEL